MRIWTGLGALALALIFTASPVLAGPTVRLMSYNVRVDVSSDNPRWAERRDPMAKQIAFTAPDIFGVQEAAQTAVADLADRLPGYDHYGLGRDDGKNGETTALFYSRERFERLEASTQWCSKTPGAPGKDADAAYPRTITRLVLRDKLSGRLLDVRNTHFDNVGVVARENCARQLEAIPRYKEAVVMVMGDFNTGVDSTPYRILSSEEGLNLKDARIGAAIDFGPAGTFNDFKIAQTNGEAIDHIFVDRALTVSRFAVLTDSFDGRVISDHFPIVADVVLP
ncbi:endonuclease/exonuclease/phosphatase family protein [Asticcacaulis sp.]|uniref:endonuclease/exonuclease/phosphatase family protein n=1 Tax=Asticcacaulis sp. TaxID=1872648 RepID=UPI002C999369|nr:endonuclease/exonuclease/phosphatase family protein [Asticcacaulis sp.]HTM80769.1 endonuclease/exonuclease/phosphatase family protein [Asticcacaulis sp.]